MKIAGTIILIFQCCLLSAQSHQSDTISLEALFEFALEHSLEAKEAHKNLAVALAQFDFTQSTWKPFLGLSANVPAYSKTFQETIQPNGSIAFQPVSQNFSVANLSLSQVLPLTGGTIFLNSALQRFDDFSNETINYNGKPIRFGISQPVLGFNPVKWQKLVEPQRLTEAKKQFAYDLEFLKSKISQLYFDIVQADLEVQIAQQNQKNNQKLYTIAQERFELGKISENDLLQLELELVQAHKDYKSNEQNYRSTYQQLLNYIGGYGILPIAKPVIPSHPNSFSVDFNLAKQFAQNNRFELTQQQRRIGEQEMELARTKRSFGPQIDLVASLGVSRGSEKLSEIYTDAQQEQRLSISFELPILDWGRRKHQVRMQELELDFLANEAQQIRKDMEAEVENTIYRFINLQEELALASEVKRVADRRFGISNESYVLGNISITDLTIAINEKDRATREYVNTLRNYWEAYYDLRLMTLYDFENENQIIYPIEKYLNN